MRRDAKLLSAEQGAYVLEQLRAGVPVVRVAASLGWRLPTELLAEALAKGVEAAKAVLGGEAWRLRDVHLPGWARELHLDVDGVARVQAALVLLLEVHNRVESDRALAMSGRAT